MGNNSTKCDRCDQDLTRQSQPRVQIHNSHAVTQHMPASCVRVTVVHVLCKCWPSYYYNPCGTSTLSQDAPVKSATLSRNPVIMACKQISMSACTDRHVSAHSHPPSIQHQPYTSELQMYTLSVVHVQHGGTSHHCMLGMSSSEHTSNWTTCNANAKTCTTSMCGNHRPHTDTPHLPASAC
jgi:hypothetical protein